MRTHFTLRRGDTQGAVVYVHHRGLPAAIATATAVFNAQSASAALVVSSAAATITAVTARPDGTYGATFTCPFTTAMSNDAAGEYRGEFLVTYPGGAVQTLPGDDDELTYELVEAAGTLDLAAAATVTVGYLQTQAAHGFAQFDLVRWTGSSWAKARGDSDTTVAQAIVNAVEDAASFRVIYLSGTEWTCPAHGKGAGGTKLYLSQATDGAITSSRPSVYPIQQIGLVKDANTLILQGYPLEAA